MGRVTLAATAREEFLSDFFCRNKIRVFFPRTVGNEVVFSVSGRDAERVRLLALRSGVSCRTVRDATVKTAVKNNVGRIGLYLGLALVIALTTVYSVYLTRLEIGGNAVVATEEIAAVVERYVLFPSKKSNPDLKKISVEVAKLDGIAHATVYERGNVLHVDVTEELPKVELFDRTDYADVTSSYDGVVTRVIAYDGRALVSAGDEVKAGDVLISSAIPLDEETLLYRTKPFGEIYGIVRFTKEVVIPDTRIVLRRSGASTSISSFFVEKEVASPYRTFEVERKESYLYNLFPFKIYTQTFFECVETEETIDETKDREAILAAEKERFFSELPAGGEKPVFSYAIKRLDKSTLYSLYYDIEIKLN